MHKYLWMHLILNDQAKNLKYNTRFEFSHWMKY